MGIAGVLAVLLVQLPESGHVHAPEAGPTASNDTPISVFINPEARVSASRNDQVPLPSAACGQVIGVAVTIVNQAFLTAPLEVRLVEPRPHGVSLAFSPQPLQGLPMERRVIQLTLTDPNLVDLTVAFGTKNNIPDLGGRDRVHFLLHCHSGNEGA